MPWQLIDLQNTCITHYTNHGRRSPCHNYWQAYTQLNHLSVPSYIHCFGKSSIKKKSKYLPMSSSIKLFRDIDFNIQCHWSNKWMQTKLIYVYTTVCNFRKCYLFADRLLFYVSRLSYFFLNGGFIETVARSDNPIYTFQRVPHILIYYD